MFLRERYKLIDIICLLIIFLKTKVNESPQD